MAEDFLGQILNDRHRAKLLRVFVFNQSESFTLVQAAKRSGLSTRKTDSEIRALEKLGLIKKGRFAIALQNGSGRKVKGKQKVPTWSFNTAMKHSLAVSKFVYEVSPLHYETVINTLKRSSRPTAVILSGCFVGDPTRPADMIVAADGFNEKRIEQAMLRLEPVLGREIRYAAFSTPEFRYRLTIQDRLIRDTLDYPHLVLLDKTRML